MDKEVKNRILLGKNGTKYVVANKYADDTYSLDAIPNSEIVKFISNNELYMNKTYIIDRNLKGYKLNSLDVTFGNELDTDSKYAIYSLDSNGLMRVINLDTFGILECIKWNFQFLSKEKGFKKPYINIYLKSASGALECYAVTNLIIDETGSLDSRYYLGVADYNFGVNLKTFRRINCSNIKRGRAPLALRSKLAYSPHSMSCEETLDIIDKLDYVDSHSEMKSDIEKENTSNITLEKDNSVKVNNDNTAETRDSIETDKKSGDVADDKLPDEIVTEHDEVDETSDKPDESESELSRSSDIKTETEAETVSELVETMDKPDESESKIDKSVNEMDRFYDSNGNCIDIEGLMAYLDSQQIEKQLEETNKIDSKSNLADIMNKDTDLYQTYKIDINKLDAYKDMLGILSIYDTITLDKELSHKCLVIDDIVSGSTVKYIESGIDKDGVVQVNAENVPLNVIYICYVSNNGHKKYYLMHENQDVDTVKIQCISDTMKDYDYFNTNEFRQKYNNNKLNIQYIKL